MTQEAITDYLGHPCKFTEAKEYFHSFDDAQNREFRNIKRNVGNLLLVLSARLNHSRDASCAICDLIQSIDDSEQPSALMKMLTAYETGTSNMFYEFAGLVLAGFETGGLNLDNLGESNEFQGRA